MYQHTLYRGRHLTHVIPRPVTRINSEVRGATYHRQTGRRSDPRPRETDRWAYMCSPLQHTHIRRLDSR